MRLCRGADLTMGAPEADSAEPQSSMLTVFEELKETPVGVVIYDQISQLLSDEEAAQRHIQRVYGMLLRLLLDAYASDPSLAHVNSINTKLNELRHALEAAGGVLSPAPSLTTPEEEPAPTKEGGPSSEVGLSNVLNELLRGESATVPSGKAVEEVAVPPKAPEPPSVAEKAKVETADARTPPEGVEAPESESVPEAGGPATPSQLERRVNSAYRLHLDRKRGEIAKLQEAFAQNVGEAIAQNREFGALLQIELNALQQAENGQEIETLRQILIGGIEELIQGHRSLEVKLRRTSEFLRLIKSDSDRLRDELNKVRLLSLTDEYTGLPGRNWSRSTLWFTARAGSVGSR